jgi:hypothetical protein
LCVPGKAAMVLLRYLQIIYMDRWARVSSTQINVQQISGISRRVHTDLHYINIIVLYIPPRLGPVKITGMKIPYLKLKLIYDRRSVGKSVLVSGSYLEPMTRFLFSV